jgi:hypothetical protein
LTRVPRLNYLPTIIRGPGFVNLDLGLIKTIPIKDKMRVQLRTEIFNLTNTPHFAMPVLWMSDPAFGRTTPTRNPINFGSTATSFANRMSAKKRGARP